MYFSNSALEKNLKVIILYSSGITVERALKRLQVNRKDDHLRCAENLKLQFQEDVGINVDIHIDKVAPGTTF